MNDKLTTAARKLAESIVPGDSLLRAVAEQKKLTEKFANFAPPPKPNTAFVGMFEEKNRIKPHHIPLSASHYTAKHTAEIAAKMDELIQDNASLLRTVEQMQAKQVEQGELLHMYHLENFYLKIAMFFLGIITIGLAIFR